MCKKCKEIFKTLNYDLQTNFIIFLTTNKTIINNEITIGNT